MSIGLFFLTLLLGHKGFMYCDYITESNLAVLNEMIYVVGKALPWARGFMVLLLLRDC